MAFDPTTAYRGDYQWFDFVDAATLEIPNDTGTPDKVDGLKVRRSDLDTTDFLALAAGLALSSSAAAFIVWPPVTTDTDEVVELDVRQGCVLRIDPPSAGAGQGWLVQAHTRSRFGYYLMVCDQEVVNAAT